MAADTNQNTTEAVGLYGLPSDALKITPAGAFQLSPLIPGSARLDDLPEASLASLTVMAPPGTVERRAVLAMGLKALRPGGTFVAAAPKQKGGGRLGDELRAFGCEIEETSRRHHRICELRRPDQFGGDIETAVAAGAPRRLDTNGLWSQPGIFSWDRVDPGSALLLENLPSLSGHGADLGCGIGVLSRAALASLKVKELAAIDVDRRALDAARRNVVDPRLSLRWLDLATHATGLTDLNFVVTNPPFHRADGGEDHDLGRLFIRRAAESLRRGGALWLVANRHLPYEAVLGPLFSQVRPVAERDGFKVVEARR